MPRKSPIHYIYPSAISVTPNANDSENDLAVTVIGGAKIKVYSPKSGISMSGGVYQEWSLTGRNRRLSQSGSPYTIYARLAKSDKSKGYLVFAPKDERDGKWYDKYCYVTPDGIFPQLSASHPEGCRVVDNVNWWVRLGDVSLPEGGKRTVSFDTGILGTDEFNTEWAVSPDSMPMRIEIGCVIDDEDAGPTPYVYWDKMLNLTATLVEGWTGTDIERFDHWEISRNTGDAAADAAWPSAERASLFAHTGRMTLSHERGALDDFKSAVATTFTVTAWGRPDDSQDPDAALVPMKEASIVILAETVEKYEVVLSSSVVSYNPSSDTYRPEDGIAVNVRATDQRGNVYRLGRGQISAAKLVARYAHADTESWSTLQFADSPEGIAEAVIPVAAFAAQKNVNVRLENAAGKELDSRVVSFLRDGEDSREREWIFFRSKEPVVFGDASSEHPLPSLISGGEVEPDGAASGEDTNKNQDGWVPQGWWDEQHGTDDEYRYEYSSYRDYVRSSESEGEGGHWDKFTKPNTWSYYGEDAVSYRCKWLLDGVEVWQLVSSYTGAFRGTLPLVATLMKRKGSGSEEPVAATDTVITVIFEGLDASYTEAASSPQFTISEVDHPEMVSYLNDARLTNILIVFETREETFSYSIPVIKEADEDSIIQTMEEHGSELFLSKTSDDTANGFITFAKGFLSLVDVVIRGAITAAEGVINNIRSSNYTGDGIADTGFRLTSDDGTGSSALTVDNLHVRKKATFEELEVKKETAVAGNEVRSAAANVINRTDYYDESGNLLGYSYRQVPWLLKKMPFLLRHKFFGRLRKVRIELSPEDAESIARIRCYFLAKDDDRDVMNLWKADNINGHDLVRCQTFNLNSSRRYIYINGGTQKAGNVFWWRKAIAVSESPVTIEGQEYHFVDVSNRPGGYAANSDIPAAGDHIVQFGNDSNSQRMNLIIQEVNGDDAPAIKAYMGIYTFDLDKCWWGGSPRKMMLSPKEGYEFYGPSFKFVQEYGKKRASIDRGEWSKIPTESDDYEPHAQVRKCYYYDKVSHNGCYWLCVFTAEGDGAHWVDANGNYLSDDAYAALTDEQKATCSRKEDYTTAEPGTNDAVWKKLVDKGDNMVRLDIDNEMDTVQTDSTGKVTAQRTVTTVVRLYDGSREVAIGNPTVTGIAYTDADGHQQTLQPTITASGNGRQLSWTFQTGWTLQGRYQVSIGYTYQNVPYTAVFTLTASQGLAIFQLKPAMSAIPFQRDADGNLTPASKSLALDIIKIDGASTATITPATYGRTKIRYSLTEMPTLVTSGTAWPSTGSISVPNTAENVYIALFNIYDGLIDRESVPVVKDGEKGQKGDSVSYDEEHSSIGYAYSSMGTPESGRDYPSDITSWSPTPPAVQKGKYLWTKDVTAYDNAGTIVYTTTYGVQYQPNDGDSVEIDSSRTFIKYCRQTKSQYTGQHPADSDFSTTYPTDLGQGDYLWILNQVAYVGVANPLKSYSVSMLGTDGGKGDKGADGYTTHFAYATSADGSQNFSTTNFKGATYIGTYRDQKAADSTNYRDYVWTPWKGDKGDKGDKPQAGVDYPIPQNGNDAVNVSLSPEEVIVTQSTTSPYNIDLSNAETVVSVNEGGVPKSFTISNVSGTNCKASVKSGTTDTIKIDSIDTYNVTVDGETVSRYYDNGYVTFDVTYGGNTYHKRFNFYANLLGTWKETVDAGVKKVVADEVDYDFLDGKLTKNNRTYTQTASAAGKYETWSSEENTQEGSKRWMNEHINTADQNISTITKQVSGDNLFIGLDKSDSDCGWFSRAFGNSISYSPSSGILQTSTGSPYEMISPLVYLVVGRVYCISAYLVQSSFFRANNIKLYKSDRTEYASIKTVENDKTTGETMSYDQATWTRRYIRLKVDNTGWYHISFYQINGLLYPQFEFSEYPTKFNVGGTTTQSMIKQTADEIEAKVNKTGVNITDGKIEATTNKFEIWNEDKTKRTFSVDADGNLQASGGAEFKGSITTSDEMGAWEITPKPYGTLDLPTITGYSIDANGNRKDEIIIRFDSNTGNASYPYCGGGLYFLNSEAGGNAFYAREGWTTNCAGYGQDNSDGSDGTRKAWIQAAPDYTGPIIEFFDNYQAEKRLMIGIASDGVNITCNKWPTSTTTTGRVYKDDWGYLKVKDTKTYDRINVKTSSFELPDDPPIGTMFFVKRVLNDITIKTGNAYVLNGSNNGTLWEPNKTYNWDDTHSMVLFYLGEVGTTKYWTMIYSS